MALRLRGALDKQALQQALHQLTQRHEVLRTAFCNVDGEPRPLVLDHITIPIAELDLRHLPVDEREQACSRSSTGKWRRSNSAIGIVM